VSQINPSQVCVTETKSLSNTRWYWGGTRSFIKDLTALNPVWSEEELVDVDHLKKSAPSVKEFTWIEVTETAEVPKVRIFFFLVLTKKI
jgi:hypothetical protein